MPTTRACIGCGKTFTSSRVNSKPPRYCSRSCANKRPFIMRDSLRLTKLAANGCLEWQGARGRGDYAQIQVYGKTYRMHRLVWEHFNGPIPAGMVIRHSCNNPPCVNVKHLLLGTQADNIDDRERSGNTSKGSRQGLSKLSEAEVLEIKRLLEEGITGAEIARRFDVTKNTVYYINRGKTWRHI